MLKKILKNYFFQLWSKAVNHDQGRKQLTSSLNGIFQRPAVPEIVNFASPYKETGLPTSQGLVATRSDIIFITGRFRSGSTLFWNIFRQLPGFTAYYEPFNERQWFDAELRGSKTDSTHKGVTDYWLEFDGLTELKNYYREDWIRRNLYMDAQTWDSAMKRYIEILVDKAPGRPVLQFNRVDFRLPWLKHNFPNAKLVHILRHPRDQWCSFLQQLDCFGPHSGGLCDFPPADKFYLCTWVRDLQHVFPFLQDWSKHPYWHFYLLWKLSYLFGVTYSDVSLKFEDMVTNPRTELQSLFEELSLSITDWNSIMSLIQAPPFNKWRQYADDSWFFQIEAECEQLLSDFLRPPLELRTLVDATP